MTAVMVPAYRVGVAGLFTDTSLEHVGVEVEVEVTSGRWDGMGFALVMPCAEARELAFALLTASGAEVEEETDG